MAEAVVYRLPTTQFEVNFLPVRVGFVKDKVSLGQMFVSVLFYPGCIITLICDRKYMKPEIFKIVTKYLFNC